MLLMDVAAVKRTIEYEDVSETTFYKSSTRVSTDVITILGSGATTLMAAASALTLLSLA